MAKQFDKITIPVELQVNDNGVAKKLEQEVKGLEKVAAKGLVYQIQLDKNNYANIVEQVSEISGLGDKIILNFQEGNLKTVSNDVLSFLQEIVTKCNEANVKFAGLGNVDGLNVNSGLNIQLQNIEQISSQIEQQKKRYNELQQEIKKYNLAVEEASKKGAQGVKDSWNNYAKSNSAKDRKEFVKQFKAFEDNGFNKSLLTGKDVYNQVFDFDAYKKKYEKQLKSLPKSFNLDKEAQKITEQFKLPFDKSQFEEYRKENNQIVAQIKELQKQKQELEKVQKESQTKKNDAASSEKKNNEIEVDKEQTKNVNEISITPVIAEGSIESIKAKIESELSNINIGIAPIETNSEIEGFKNSVNDLVTSIKEIGTAYEASVSNVKTGATTQIESINAIKSTITELESSLELVGVKTLNELPQYKEQMAQIQAEQDKLAKEKEIFQKLQEKKDKASKSGSKDKTEELTDTEKLKKAFDKTKGWTLDESSIQKQSNGITTYIAELEKAEGEAEKFLLTVGNVNDIITKNGTINKKDYLNKAQPLSPTTEDIEVKGGSESSSVIEKTIDDITRLKEIANNTVGFNIDESSIVKADDGIISFKANIANAKGELKELNYAIQDFSLVTDKSNGGFSSQFRNTGKTDNQLKEQEEKIKAAEKLNKLNSAVDKTDNFILESSNIDSSGIVTFIGYLQTADGEVKKLSYSVKDLQSVLNADGGFDKDFIGSGNLSNIEKTLDKFKTQTSENKTNQVLGVDNTAGLEKARQLEAEINELVSSENIAEEQKKAVLLEIVAAKEKEAEIYDIYDKKNGSSQNKFEKTKNKYNNVLDYVGYEDDKNSSFSNLNSNMTILDQASNKIITVKEKMEQLKTTADELYDKLSNGQFESKNVFDQTVQELQDTMKAMENLYNNPIFQNTNKDGSTFWRKMLPGSDLSSISNQEVESTLSKYLEAENRIIEKVRYDSAKRTATASIVNDDGKIEKVTMSLRSYTDAAGQAQVAVHKLNVETGKEYLTSGQKWVDGVKKKFASLSQYVTGLTLVTSAWSKIKEGFSFVKSLDSSLTTINQTMNTTQEQLDDLGQGAIDAGKDLSTSAENVLDAAAIYANANETTESVLEKAKPTVMLANASGGDVSTASDQIQSVIEQFDELEGQEERIVNSYEKISAGVAIDFQKGIGIIAEGTQNAGSVAKESGMQFEEFAASIAKVSEKTRQDGSVIGNAYKTILARTSRSQSADLDVSDEDRSKASKALSAIGISVYDQNGEYQDFSKTLDQLSGKWNQLSKSQQSYIAEQMAGIRNLNTMSAIIETWQDAKSLASDALTDTDFINETQEKYENSIEGHLEKLKASGQDFWNTLLDSGAINTGINLLSGVVDIAQKAVDVFGALGNALPVVNSGFTTLAGTLATAYAAYKVFTNVKSTESLTKGLSLTGTQFTNFFKKSIATVKEYKNLFVDGFKGADGIFSGMISGAQNAIGVMTGLQKAILGIGTAAAVITIAIKALDYFTTSSKEAEEAAQKAADSYQKAQDKISNAKTLLDSNGSEFAELSKGVTSLGENVSLTTEEFSKYHDICNQLASVFPNLVSGYDEQGNAIIKLKEGVKSLNDEYDKLRLQEANENIGNEKTYREDFGNKTGKRSFGTKLWDTITDWGSADRGGRTDNEEVLDLLEKLQNAKDVDAYNTLIQRYSENNALSNIKKELDIKPISTKDPDKALKELEQWKEKFKSYSDSIVTEIDQSGDNVKTVMQSWLTKLTLEDDDYKNIDSDMISRISTIINGIDSSKLQELEKDGVSAQQYVKSLLDGLNNSETVQEALDRILSIDDTSSIDDIKQALNEDLKTVAKALKYDDENELKVTLGLDGKEEFLNELDGLVDLVDERFGDDFSGVSKAQQKAFENVAKQGKEAAKIQFDDVAKSLESYKEDLETAYNSLVNGNIDYSKRPTKTAHEMWSKGWGLKDSKAPIEEGQTVTTYSSGYKGASMVTATEANKNLYVEVTPILDNGEVLTQESLNSYMDDLFAQDNILEADKIENGGKGIVISVFDEWDDEGLDEWQAKLDSVKQEHTKAMEISKEIEQYVNQNDSEGLQTYLDKTYDNLDSKKLKSIVKTIKQEVKESKELDKNTDKANKKSKTRAATEKRVLKFAKDNNITTATQVAKLQECVNKTNSWVDATEKFSLLNANTKFDEIASNLEQNLKTVEDDITHINEAVQASHTSIGLTKDEIENVVKAFSGLNGYNYDQLFESTAEGVHLNVQELDRLNGEYRKMQQGKYDKSIADATKEYEKLCVKISETSGAERNNYINEKNHLSDTIQNLRELQSRYEGLTNAVTRYQEAKANGEEGDTYLSIANDKDDIKELYDHGLVGTNQFKAAVQMMTNEDLSGQGTGKYLEVYKKKAEEFFSYFTENGEGVEKFLKKIEKGGFASQNKDGSWNIQANLEELSEKYDLDKSVITEIFKRLNDFGFDVDFKEESDNLRNLREEAEKAKATLNDTYQLNFETDDLATLDKEIKKGQEYREGLTKTKDYLENQVKTLEKSKKAIEEHGDTSSEAYKEICENLDDTKKKFEETSGQLENLNKELDYAEAKKGQTVEFDVDINSSAGIEKLKSEVKSLNQTCNVDLKINWDSADPTYWTNKMNEMKDVIKNLPDGKINLDTTEGKAAYDICQGIVQELIQISHPTILDMDISSFTTKQQAVAADIASLMQKSENLKNLQYQAEMGITVDEETMSKAENEVKDAAQKIASENPQVAIKLGIADQNLEGGATLKSEVANKVAEINNSDIAKAYIKVGVKKKEVEDYLTEDVNKDAKTKYDLDKSEKLEAYEKANVDKKAKTKYTLNRSEKLKEYEAKDLNRTFTTTYQLRTIGEAPHKLQGTAHLNGTAYSNGTTGDWGAKKDETALVGEVAPELRVNSRTGKWELLGEHGAEFAHINKGDVIFNGKQTEELFKNGYVTSGFGRGKTFLNGTVKKLNSLFKVDSGSAYVSGTYTTAGSLPGSNKFYNNYKWKSKKKGNDKDDKDDFSNDFDWIEVWLNRIERDIENLDTVASSVYKNFTKRNNTLVQEFSKVSEEINRQQSAYDAYMQAANSLGISSTYMDKIANGTLELETITDEDLSDKLQKAQDWYDKALDARDAIYDLKETLGDLAKQKFDNVAEEYDNQLQLIEHRITSVENGLDIVEAKGNFASQSYFDMLEKAETENINKILQEYNSLKSAFDEAMNTGVIEEGSSAWYEMQQQINEVSEAWQEATKSLIEYKNQAREMDWSIFDYKQDLISQITEESDFIQNLLSLNEADMYSKKSGKLTNVGQSVGGLHALNYNVYMAQADEYRKKVEEINKELADDPYNTKLLDQRNEYLKSQREAIENANDEKTAIHDLIEESYNRMLEILQKLIDKRKEYLQAQKDIYDYEKNIREQTKNITDLQKQLTSLQGDDSEEAQSKRQQITSDLESAKSDLQDSEYDKWLDDQEQLLDKLYDQYEEVLNERLDNLDGLVMDMIDATNNNSATINQTIQDYTTGQNGVGYQISNGMKEIWNIKGNGIGKVVSDYSTNFSNTLTTTNNYIKSINDYMYRLVQKAEKEVTKNTVASGTGTPGSSSSGSSSMPASSSSSNSGNSNNGGGNSGNFFVYKYDSYPKGKLSINTSIVDRLKYHNYDSSFGRRRSYYSAMGFGGNYTGSASQNVSMINWMKILRPSKTPLIAGIPPQP